MSVEHLDVKKMAIQDFSGKLADEVLTALDATPASLAQEYLSRLIGNVLCDAYDEDGFPYHRTIRGTSGHNGIAVASPYENARAYVEEAFAVSENSEDELEDRA